MRRKLKIDFPSLRKKDFGSIVYRVLAYCLALCGILLLIQKNISLEIIYTGVKILALIVSLALIICFKYNARSRFRPGWTLPMAILLMMAGGVYLVTEFIISTKVPTFGATTVIIILSAFNISLLVSTAFQLYALALKRWIALLSVSLLNIVYVVLLFLNVWNLRQLPLVSISIFLFIFALQCFLEGIYGLWKK